MRKINKICILTHHAPLDDRNYYKEGISLRKAGYKVDIITSRGYYDEVKDNIHLKGFKGTLLPSLLGVGIVLNVFAQQIRFFHLGLKENADVYHVPEFDLFIIAYLIKLVQSIRRKRAYVIHDVHDFYLEPSLQGRKAKLWERVLVPLLRSLDKKVSRRIDFTIGSEEPKIQKYLDYGISSKKIGVIENYVRLDLFQVQTKDFNAQDFVLGYVGGLTFARGIDKLAMGAVDFAKKNKVRIKLLLVGRFRIKEEEKLFLKYCEENIAFIEIEVTGWIPHPEVPRQIARMDICFLLFFDSKYYDKVLSGKTGPIKMYEYMACGKPTIAVNLKALKDTIEESKCGIVFDQKGGIEGISRAIEYYFRNPQQISEHGGNGRRVVEKQYNWSIAEKKLLEIYNRLEGLRKDS